MIIDFSKTHLMSLALANASMVLENAITMPDEYIKETYESEMNMLRVARSYIDLATKINLEIPDTAKDCFLKVTHNTEKGEKPLGGADIDGNSYLICKKCSAIVKDGDWKADYCPDCGTKVDWSDVND